MDKDTDVKMKVMMGKALGSTVKRVWRLRYGWLFTFDTPEDTAENSLLIRLALSWSSTPLSSPPCRFSSPPSSGSLLSKSVKSVPVKPQKHGIHIP